MAKSTFVSFDIRGREELKALFNRAGKKADNLRVPLKQAGQLMMGSIDKNFRAEGRPTKWSPLSEMTLSMRRKHGRGAKILQDTGKGKTSITPKIVSNKVLKIGTDVKYMAIHQTGRTIRRNIKIPKRTFLLFQEDDDKNIVNIFAEYLEEIIK